MFPAGFNGEGVGRVFPLAPAPLPIHCSLGHPTANSRWSRPRTKTSSAPNQSLSGTQESAPDQGSCRERGPSPIHRPSIDWSRHGPRPRRSGAPFERRRQGSVDDWPLATTERKATGGTAGVGKLNSGPAPGGLLLGRPSSNREPTWPASLLRRRRPATPRKRKRKPRHHDTGLSIWTEPPFWMDCVTCDVCIAARTPARPSSPPWS